MENLGDRRRVFQLTRLPVVTFRPRSGAGSPEVPLFEPYEENLPLQSGFYSFVIDDLGRLRVKSGNTKSHAGMAGGSNAAAAGSFKISREGKLAEIYCRSTDYRFEYKGPHDRAALYVIDYFKDHPAFSLSRHAFFQFYRNLLDSFFVDSFSNELTSEQIRERRRQIEVEGIRSSGPETFNSGQLRAWYGYQPPPPPALYTPQRDQLVATLEEDADYEPGEPKPRYSPNHPKCIGGKYNFVVDTSGWLILGVSGHHLLAGCEPVGAAGQLVFDELGIIVEINLNFSGHYRPTLSADYARYTYRAIQSHPLIEVGEACKINGRVFDEESCLTTVLKFDASELLGDTDDLDLAIEAASIF